MSSKESARSSARRKGEADKEVDAAKTELEPVPDGPVQDQAADDDDSKSTSSSSSSSDEDDDDDDLILEGVLVRNPDASDSEDTSSSSSDEGDHDEDEDDNDDDSERQEISRRKKADINPSMEDGQGRKRSSNEASPEANKKSKKLDDNEKSSKRGRNRDRKKSAKPSGPEIIPVEFTFCDMDERYFHGLKTLLASSSPAYASNNPSALADLMVENVSVGTVISTEADHDEGNVYGFASVLNVTTYQEHECIQGLKKLCLSKCPLAHKAELETVLSGKTKRPAGFLMHGRMVNLPLEIVEVLHQQLVLDMDWAVENAEGGEEERKSLNFGAFVRLAPTYRISGVTYYKFFDDEIFAQRAEFKYEIELPTMFGMEETPLCCVIVIAKSGHRAAMQDLKEMVQGGTGA